MTWSIPRSVPLENHAILYFSSTTPPPLPSPSHVVNIDERSFNHSLKITKKGKKIGRVPFRLNKIKVSMKSLYF